MYVVTMTLPQTTKMHAIYTEGAVHFIRPLQKPAYRNIGLHQDAVPLP
jgi:hypothetical protein